MPYNAYEEEKRRLEKELEAEKAKRKKSGKAIGTSAIAGAASGAAAAAAATAWFNAIPIGGQIAYGTSMALGALIGAVTASSITAANEEDGFKSIITGGTTEKNLQKKLDELARTGQMPDLLHQIGGHTYMKVSALRRPRSVKQARAIRDYRRELEVRTHRESRLPRADRTEKWVLIKPPTPEEDPRKSPFIDAGDPTQIRSSADVMSRLLQEITFGRSSTGDEYSGVTVPLFTTLVDTAFWDLDGDGNSLFQNLIYRPIESAAKGDITVGTMFNALTINMLGAKGAQSDFLGNLVKGSLKEGMEGFTNALGVGTFGERHTYHFDTGSILSDIVLGMAWDPATWMKVGLNFSSGVKAANEGSKIAKTVAENAAEASKDLLKELGKASQLVDKSGIPATVGQIEKLSTKRINKSFGSLMSKNMGDSANSIIESTRDKLARVYLETKGIEVTKKSLAEVGKLIPTKELQDAVSQELWRNTAPKVTSKVMNSLIKEGFALSPESSPAIQEYVNRVILETLHGGVTAQIQKTIKSPLLTVGRKLNEMDRLYSRFSTAASTFGMSEGVRYLANVPIKTLPKGVTRHVEKSIKERVKDATKRIPLEARMAVVGGVVGAAAGGIIGGNVTEDGKGSKIGAIVGGIALGAGASIVANIVHGSTMRAILKGIPRRTELYEQIKQGRVPLKEYPELLEQYNTIFNIQMRTIDGDLIRTNMKVKTKTSWFTSNTAEGLNPLQLITLNTINADTQYYKTLIRDPNKTASEISGAWRNYISDRHNLSPAEYTTALKAIGSAEQGRFSRPIGDQALYSQALEARFMNEQITLATESGKLTKKQTTAKRVEDLTEAVEKVKEKIKGTTTQRGDKYSIIKLHEEDTYYKMVQHPVAILEDFIDIFAEDSKMSEALVEWLNSSANPNDAFRTLHGHVENITKLHQVLQLIKVTEAFTMEGYDTEKLRTALIKSFWDLRNYPEQSPNELLETWITLAGAQVHGARLAGTKGLASVESLRDDMRKIITLTHTDGSLFNSMKSFNNITAPDGFLHRVDATYKRNAGRIKHYENKMNTTGLSGAEKETLHRLKDQNVVLLDWKIRIRKAHENKKNFAIPGIEGFSATMRSLEEIESITPFGVMQDLQNTMGLDFALEEGADVSILNKFFLLGEGDEIEEHLLNSLGELARNAKAANDVVTDLAPLAEGTLARTELDYMWNELTKHLEKEGSALGEVLRRDLNVKERYALLYAISQAMDYNLDHGVLKPLFHPLRIARRQGTIRNLDTLLRTPDTLGFGSFRPGLRNQIRAVSKDGNPMGATNFMMRKAQIDSQAEKTLGSLSASKVRARKGKTLAEISYFEKMYEVAEASKENVNNVRALVNTLGERIDSKMRAPDSGNAGSMLAKMSRVPQSIAEAGGESIFTKYEISHLKNYWEHGKIPLDPDVMKDIARKADTYESTRWNAERVMKRHVPDFKRRAELMSILHDSSELQDKVRLSDGKVYAARYAENLSGSSLSKNSRDTIIDILDASNISTEDLSMLKTFLHSKDAESLKFFKENFIRLGGGADDAATETVLSLVKARTEKFTVADALRYLITKQEMLDDVEFAEYTRIMQLFDNRFAMSTIPIDLIPNSYMEVWTQIRLAEWNSQAVSMGKNIQKINTTAAEYNSYKHILDGVKFLGNSEKRQAAEAYLKQFQSMPGDYLGRMQTSADAVLFKSILGTLSDEEFWEKAAPWQQFINRYYTPQYEAVYLANYAEFMARGQIDISKKYNPLNAIVRRETMTDLMSGAFEYKLDPAPYIDILKEAGVEDIPTIEVPNTRRSNVHATMPKRS